MPYDFTTLHRNCLVEQVTPLPGNLTGTLPPWLRGSYLLDGPGRMTYGENEFNHIFDGSALIQKFTLGENGATFSSRFLRSYAYTTNLENEQIVVSEFGTTGKSLSKSKLGKLGEKLAFDKLFSDNAPVGVVVFGGEYYCITEAPFLHKIDPSTLETISKVDLHKELGINSQCPNPKLLSDGTVINVLHGVGATGPKYDIVAFPKKPVEGRASVFSKPKKVGSVDARWKLNPCHMHTFGLTENYVVLLEQPLTIDVKATVTNTILDKPFIGGMEWMENKLERGATLGSELDGGCVRRVVVPLNVPEKVAPEENLVKLAGSRAKALKQKDGSLILTADTITKIAYEVPSIHPQHTGRKYRYFYGNSGDMTVHGGKVGKVDMDSREVKEWHEEGMYASVTAFVPRPGATAEDDGVLLLTALHSDDRKKTTLMVLDATEMKEMARVEFMTPSDVTKALHGLFIPE
ncbi:beta,beta-carotene 15,15'-dioxygenase-like isoform X2 [Penaeus indicus]|uniref:beta,beta-carotene 15,15'-dioxygenase-like isoform X2 n=1 Tax=Penaeus indicus TaxID=29960 RepID=UPI00300D2EA3